MTVPEGALLQLSQEEVDDLYEVLDDSLEFTL